MPKNRANLTKNSLTPAAVFLLTACVAVPVSSFQPTAQPSAEDLSIQAFLQVVETAITTANREQWEALLSPNADRGAALEFFDTVVPPGATRVVVRERDRAPLNGALPGEGFQLVADVFIETGARGRIYTWRLDVRKPRDAEERQPWRLMAEEQLSSIEGLHNLSLNPDKQYNVKDLLLRSVDLELRVANANVFVAETTEGVTGVVVLGDGTMRFTPTPSEERGQVRLYAGDDSIDTSFTTVFVRLNPFEFAMQMDAQLAEPVVPDARTRRRAQAVFDEEVGKSFSLDLRDLSRENWSLLPQTGDFLAEVRTRRFGTLTFARAMAEAEDVTLFHRERQRNIAAYASEMKLSSRGRFFNEDDLVEYDVLDYQLETVFSPDRSWLDGHARMRLRIKAFALAALTVRLADEFTVSSVTSDRLGRLMYLRVRNQNNVVINLPTPVPRDLELTLNIAYAGPIRTQSIDQESVDVEQSGRQPRADDLPYIPGEENWLFSNRSHWYPQSPVTDYATSRVQFSVPADYTVVASGLVAAGSPQLVPVIPNAPPLATFVFEATEPVRYIGAVISKFTRVERTAVALDVPGPRNTVLLMVEANRRQVERGREIVPVAAEILQLYASLVGEVPYDEFTIAMVENERPGGHSPGYFAVLNNPLPIMPWVPRQDPAAFGNYPEFYIAHEIAHQWWGQAVGWKNYHEQWLSEGFAQYFAALYAHQRRGEPAFRDMLRHMRRWAMDQSDQGAVYLGYRLGHIKGDSRVFRAIVYNKGAAVLHMLRRWMGDEAFFGGLQRFYSANRYQKAGTPDLEQAMSEAAGHSLERFFERWVYASGLPRVRYSSSVEGQDVVVRFEQVGDVYDIPVTVTLTFSDTSQEEVVALTDAVVEKRFPLQGSLRAVEVNADHGALGHFERR